MWGAILTDNNQQQHTTIVQPQGGVVSVATGAVDALRGTPMLLVLVLLNCAFIMAAAYYLRAQQMNVTSLVDKMMDRCLPQHPLNYPYPPARPYVPTPNNPNYGELENK